MRSGNIKLRIMRPLQKTSSTPRWLAIRFPQLSLDLLTRGQSTTSKRAGAEPQFVERDEAAEQQAIARLAAWCYQYSNQVCIPGDRSGLFLEVGASERLFGRPEHLGKRLEQELEELGYHTRTGSAPTPEAAWLAARESLHITSRDQLRLQLNPLPLSHLHLDNAQQIALVLTQTKS